MTFDPATKECEDSGWVIAQESCSDLWILHFVKYRLMKVVLLRVLEGCLGLEVQIVSYFQVRSAYIMINYKNKDLPLRWCIRRSVLYHLDPTGFTHVAVMVLQRWG